MTPRTSIANLCLEYTHSMNVTGTYTAGLRLRLQPGLTRYCITFHSSDGETFDRVNEYINGAVWWLNLVLTIVIGLLDRRVRASLAKLPG
jgi:hypothetical protein